MALKTGRWLCIALLLPLLWASASCRSQPASSPLAEKTGPHGAQPDDLAEHIREARPLPESLSFQAAEQDMVLVPLDDRLHHIQAALLPDIGATDAQASPKWYLGYGYARGVPLGGKILNHDEYAHTQEVIIRVRLVAEIDGAFCLVEEKQGVGGAGAESYQELVRRAVEALEVSAQAANTLQSILGYATGLDWDSSQKPDQRVTLLRAALRSPYWADRKQASESLGGMGAEAKEALPDLNHALLDTESRVRMAAVRALGQIGPAATVIPILTEVLGDDDAQVGLVASEALAGFGEGAVPALIQALGHVSIDNSAAIREGAAEALRLIGPEARDAVPTLIWGLRYDDCRYVRVGSLNALQAITGQKFGADYERWLQYWREQSSTP